MGDVSDQHHPQDRRIAELEAEVARLREQMQSLVATVSHDLRAPLRHITSYAQLVQEDAGPLLEPEVQGFLNTIVDSARHMGGMLDALLELSRTGSAALQLEELRLSEQVALSVNVVQARYPTQQVQWRIASDLPVVQADAALLQKALCAVLDNALKFSAPRTPAVIDVTVQPLPGTSKVTLCIQDNGVGFQAGPQSRLFQPFQRLHTVREFAGLGIGLAIAQKAVDRMEGSISIEAQRDQGCQVQISLPAAPTH